MKADSHHGGRADENRLLDVIHRLSPPMYERPGSSSSLLHFDDNAVGNAVVLEPLDIRWRQVVDRPCRSNLADNDLFADPSLGHLHDFGEAELAGRLLLMGRPGHGLVLRF